MLSLLLLLCVLQYCCCCCSSTAPASCSCRSSSCAGWQKMLLVNLIPVLSPFKGDLFVMYPLIVLSHLQPRFAYILGIYGGESPPEYGIISYQICKCQVPPASRPIHLSLRRVGSEWFSKTAAGSNHKALCRKKKEPPKSSSYE